MFFLLFPSDRKSPNVYRKRKNFAPDGGLVVSQVRAEVYFYTCTTLCIEHRGGLCARTFACECVRGCVRVCGALLFQNYSGRSALSVLYYLIFPSQV